MLTLRRIAATLRRWLARNHPERELHDEIENYAEMLSDEHVAAGVSAAEAHRRARVELGGVAQVEESVRQGRTGALVEQTIQDIRYALRGLRRTPAFTAVVVITVGLGLGFTTAVFAVIDTMLLRPVPYERPEQLVELGHVIGQGTPDAFKVFGLSWDELRLWRRQTQIYAAVEAHDLTLPPMDWRETGRTLHLGRFTTGLPSMLGLAPTIGRTFTTDEGSIAAPVILLSDALWRSAFDGRRDVLGQIITLDRTRFTVIGVMPKSFRYGPAGGARIDGWTTLPERGTSATPDADQTMALGRLRPGLSLEAANALAEAATPEIQSQLPRMPESERWQPQLSTQDSWRWKSARGTVLQPLLALLAIGAIVIVIACANVANLLRARGASRRAELITRAALGASRLRLARLLAAEGAALTALIAIASAGIAWISMSVARVLMPRELALQLFEAADPQFDWRIAVLMACLLSVVMALSSVVPAIRLSRARLVAAARGGAIGEPRPRSALVLQSVQVALALVLVVGAALTARSLWSIVSTDVGFDHEHLVTLVTQLSPDRYRSPDAKRAAAARLLEIVRTLPGVSEATPGPLPASNLTSFYFEIAGHEPVRGTRVTARVGVGPGYFDVAGIRLLAGREFGPQDGPGAEPAVILDQGAAKRFFGERSPLGERVRTDPQGGFATVVGLVDVVFTTGFPTQSEPLGIYPSFRQWTPSTYVSMVIRARGQAAPLAAVVRDAVRTAEPDLRSVTAQAADTTFDNAETYQRPRFALGLVLACAVCALVTAAIGLFGALSYAVAQRRREIAVRMALGSSVSAIRRLVLAHALVPVAVGLLMGAVAALMLSRYAASMLYGVVAHDPISFGLGAVVLTAAALIATIGPVRSATGIDLIRALRAE